MPRKYAAEDAGMTTVTIDGNEVAEVDQYSYSDLTGLTGWSRSGISEVPFIWSKSGLDEGEHTIRVTILSRKKPSSQGTRLNVRRQVAYP